MRIIVSDAYATEFLYKYVCCGYSFELPQLDKAIQMSTRNISFYAPTIFIGGGGGGGGGGGVWCAYSITAVRPLPSVLYVTQIVSVRYLLKGLVYWIEILYTGITS